MPRQSLHVTVEKDRSLSYIGVVTQHRPSIGFHLILLLVALSSAHSQDVSISLSPQIDTLSSRLLRNPDDRALQLRLIDAYTLSFNPELALLELLNAEGQGKLIREGVGIKGTVQLSLEQTSAEFSSLAQSYLASPSDETLFLIAIVEYARGERQRGYWEMSRLKPRIADLSVKLLGLYERFYLNGRRVVARAILSALQDVDPVAYGTYFPAPQISILSPNDNVATEASQVSVVCEVRHSRPVQTVRVGGTTVYDKGEWKGGSANEGFNQSYTTLVSVLEGRNPVIVHVTDIFGNETRDTVIVNGMNFNLLASWESPLVDTLRKGLQYLRNYVPDSILVTGRRNAARALIIAGSVSADSADSFDRGLFLHEFFTHPVSGIVPQANTKILVKNRVEEHTMRMVLDDWLLKGATFQNVTSVYWSGDWRITEGHWLLRDLRGGWIEMKVYADRLRSLATAGVVLMVDGVIDNRPLFEAELRALVETAAIPFEVVILPRGGTWPADWSRAVMNPAAAAGASDGDYLTTPEIQRWIPGSIVIRGGNPAIPIAKNPAALIAGTSRRMISLLTQKLAKEKIDDATRRRVMAFGNDWRRFHEVARYLGNQFSISDFVIRVDEYQRRAGGGQ